MSKKYMDFMPSQAGAKPVVKRVSVATSTTSVTMQRSGAAVQSEVSRRAAVQSEMSRKTAAQPVIYTEMPEVKTNRRVVRNEALQTGHTRVATGNYSYSGTSRVGASNMSRVGTDGTSRVATTKVIMRTPAAKTQSRESFSIKNEPELGVIEDLNPKFVNTNVAKRPLSGGTGVGASAITTKNEVKEPKKTATRKGFGGRFGRKTEKNEALKKTKAERKAKNDKYVVPKSPFINQEKVIKRPLSKNVYAKKVEEPKAKKTGPVTIIAKPEKEAHTSLVVTIILTIILGAAAGTVAFLLLPK